jgi:hypothetical protein
MALETIFRRFSLLPGLIQAGNGEPRNKSHWIGNRPTTTPQPDQQQGGSHDRSPRRSDTSKYRDLASITLGEVQEAYNHFQSQLVPSPAEAWIARNYFCQVPLRSKGEERPPVVFGRVRTSYPGDGYINNIKELEMYFPRRDAAPNLLHIGLGDVLLEEPTHSYCVGVKCYLSVEEMADFSRSENIFLEKGFAPLYESGYLDLLDVNEQNQTSLPWLYVIGSGWFASIPDSVQPEVREQLRDLVRWEKVVFNYHPRRYSLQVRALNEELDFQYGFTEHYLVAPQDSGQVLKKVEEEFQEIFVRGME